MVLPGYEGGAMSMPSGISTWSPESWTVLAGSRPLSLLRFPLAILQKPQFFAGQRAMASVNDIVIEDAFAAQEDRGPVAASLPDHPFLQIAFGRELDKMEVALLTPPKAV